MTATAARRLAGLLVAAALAGCSSGSTAATAPDLPHGASEAPVAVTVPSGPETRPAWQRADDHATLTIPADLLFATDSADVGPGAAGVLGQVLAEVRAQPGALVLVEGHADSDGDAGHNQELSERRAAAVGDRLAAGGVEVSTITTKGWGEDQPAVAETDDAAKAANRRVVVTVTYSNAPSPGRTR
jgi:outer membrane protein OmpA-like peptidoglycan-associated protein